MFLVVIVLSYCILLCATNLSADSKLEDIPTQLEVSVAVVSMVKNEGDILRQWLDYHSALFGLSNMIVLDNFSTCNVTGSILKEFAQKGLHVMYEQGPYIDMGDISHQAVKKILPDHKLALPLDVDEFLVAYTHSSPQVNRALIWKHLSHMWSSGGPCYGFKQYYSSYPMGANYTLGSLRHFTRNTYPVRVAKKIYWLQDTPQHAFGGHQGVRLEPGHGRQLSHHHDHDQHDQHDLHQRGSDHHDSHDPRSGQGHYEHQHGHGQGPPPHEHVHEHERQHGPPHSPHEYVHEIPGEREHMKCKNAQDRLGLLHYHLRSPLGTAQRALRDCVSLQYLPAHATLESIQNFTRPLRLLLLQQKLRAQTALIATHKIEELLSYAQYGEDAFVYGKIDHLEEVGTLQEIISSLRAT